MTTDVAQSQRRTLSGDSNPQPAHLHMTIASPPMPKRHPGAGWRHATGASLRTVVARYPARTGDI